MEARVVRRLDRAMTTSTSPEQPGLQALIFVTALGCGLAAGVFFAFSGFVMSALNRLPAAQGIAAMQSINITVVRPLFMIDLFGTALITLPLLVIGIRHRGERWGLLLIVGAVLYLAGTIALTAIYHVPRNNALDLLDPMSPDAAAQWHDFFVGWTRWNHVRTLSSLGAMAAFMGALVRT
jgi:uncharacterized membrane protein